MEARSGGIEKDTAWYPGAGIVVPSGGGKDGVPQDKQRQQAGEYARNPQPQKPLLLQICHSSCPAGADWSVSSNHIQSQFPHFLK